MKARAWIAFFLSLALVVAGVTAGPPKHKKNLKDLKAHKREVSRKRKELAQKMRQTARKASRVRGNIQSIDQHIGELQARIASTNRKLKNNQAAHVVLTAELEKKTKELQIRSDQARIRLREIYMHGEASLASAIVGSQSLSDLASRKFVFERIAERDRQLFESVRTLQIQVKQKRKAVENLIAEDKDLIDQQKTDKAELQDERQDKVGALQDIKDQYSQYQQLKQELDQEENELESQIQAFQVVGHGMSGPGPGGKLGIPVYNARMASGFGMRYHPILHYTRLHAGQDFAAPYGSEIHAAAAGVVIAAKYTRGYGNTLMIDHGGGISTLYGHCSRILVGAGAHVGRGQVVALVGATGLATGPHCHFEVRISGRPVNPMGWLR